MSARAPESADGRGGPSAEIAEETAVAGDRATATSDIRRPWHRDPSIIVAALSLLISSITGIYTIVHTRQTDTSERRTELIGYVQRLIALYQDSKLDEEEVATVGNQAAETLSSIPGVSATVYRQIAYALAEETIYLEKADELANEAIRRAEESDDRYEVILGHRVKALILRQYKNLDGVRREFQKALDLSLQYRGPNLVLRYNTAVHTEIQWARAEIEFGQCTEARRHKDRAEFYVRSTPASAGSFSATLQELEAAVKSCKSD